MSTEGDDVYKFAWPFPRRSSLFFKICSNIVLTSVFLASKLLFSFNWNRITVTNKEKLLRLLADRSRPLITIANHRCTVDDPLLWTIFSFREFFANVSRFRYALAAHNICFTNAWHTKFFSLGQCVPVVRGAGVYQRGVDFCIEKLAENRWVHLFPEGKVTPHPIRIKWGIARMIMECPTPPMVLPIWIQRMNEVWSPSPPYHPLFGKHVHVTVGDELDMSECLPHLCGNTEIERRKAIADFVQQRLFDLGKRLESQLEN